MSVQTVKDFIRRASTDPKIRAEVQKQTDNIMDIARKNGHDFTKEEFEKVMRDRFSKPSGGGSQGDKDKGGENEDPHFCFICI
ncbi:MAG TPA: Nif11-like leader peptide family natural product precursor [Thermoanaerobaculia bacterium]|nr:Nif11-like leader peptide family natural product precursor [Thermoanaerobaculia bacterium]